MQAIVFKFHGPTNSRGARISATAQAGRVTIPYPYHLDKDSQYRAALDAFLVKYPNFASKGFAWGYLPDGNRVAVPMN